MPRQKPKTDYEEIRAIWYKKLEESGFTDIEQDEDNLKSWSIKLVGTRHLELKESRQSYYYMATNFINDYRFSNELEKTIWEYHANGLSVRTIATILQDAGIKRAGYTTVWSVVKRLRECMKRMYMSNYE